jgi:hypothetical protein
VDFFTSRGGNVPFQQIEVNSLLPEGAMMPFYALQVKRLHKMNKVHQQREGKGSGQVLKI